jgi:hypothetical protein
MPTLAWPARAGRRSSIFAVFDPSTLSVRQTRVNHQPGAIKAFLADFPEGTSVALETVGNYYCLHLWCRHRWIVDEIEQAGCIPLLAHAAKAKVIIPRPTSHALQ